MKDEQKELGRVIRAPYADWTPEEIKKFMELENKNKSTEKH